MAVTGFFRTAAVNATKKSAVANAYMDVGGEQFRALAVALIGCFQDSASDCEAITKTLLEHFSIYYPKVAATQAHLSSPERLNRIMQSIGKLEFVPCLSYVLRQITVSELYNHPLKYREVFTGLSPDRSKQHLRELSTQLPELALAASAQSLGIALTLYRTEPGKEIRQRIVYNAKAFSKLNVVLQLQGDYYFPQVKGTKLFCSLEHPGVHKLKPVKEKSYQAITVADILSRIEADNQRVLALYQQRCNTLFAMVDASELSKQDLIRLFIEFSPEDNECLLDARALFSQTDRSKRQAADLGLILRPEQEQIKRLCELLAEWVSTNQIDADELFEGDRSLMPLQNKPAF